MPIPRRTLALAFAAVCLVPGFADEPKKDAPEAPKEAIELRQEAREARQKAREAKREAKEARREAKDSAKETKESCCDDQETRHVFHWHHHSDFAWQAQLDTPVTALGRAMDNRNGAGLGMQWTTYHSHGGATRTRLEWNVFPEGNAVGAAAVKTKASNYILSFDHLYFLSGQETGVYVMGGLGVVRWFTEQTVGTLPAAATHTTKLAVSAGLGLWFNRAWSAEARYLVSSMDRPYDGNVVQTSLSVRF